MIEEEGCAAAVFGLSAATLGSGWAACLAACASRAALRCLSQRGTMPSTPTKRPSAKAASTISTVFGQCAAREALRHGDVVHDGDDDGALACAAALARNADVDAVLQGVVALTIRMGLRCL